MQIYSLQVPDLPDTSQPVNLVQIFQLGGVQIKLQQAVARHTSDSNYPGLGKLIKENM